MRESRSRTPARVPAKSTGAKRRASRAEPPAANQGLPTARLKRQVEGSLYGEAEERRLASISRLQREAAKRDVEAQGDHVVRLIGLLGQERDQRIRAELRVRVYAEIMVTICHRLATETKKKPDIVIRAAQKEITDRMKEYDSGWMEV